MGQEPDPSRSPGPVSGIPDEPRPFEPFACLGTVRISDSRWCGLRRDTLKLHTGREQEHHVVEISDAVAVVPVLADGRIALIGQYRYVHGRTHWEVPAGRVGPGESARAAAERELLEEAGLASANWTELPGFYPINGISPHWAHAFLAEDCTVAGEPMPEESEQLARRFFTREEVERLLDAGRFADAFTALSIAYWLRRAPR